MKYLALIPILFLAGCAVFQPLEDEMANKAAEVIVEYCVQTDSNFREGFRAKVNDLVPEGHGAEITCP